MKLQTVLDDIQKRPGTGEVIPVFDPSTEEQITEFKDCGQEAVNDAVARAKDSFESGVWRGLPGSERAKVLWRVADLIDQNATVLAELESLNAGMTPLQAEGTVSVSSEFFRYYAGWCTEIRGHSESQCLASGLEVVVVHVVDHVGLGPVELGAVTPTAPPPPPPTPPAPKQPPANDSTPTTGCAPTASTKPASSPCASPAACTTSASAEPTPAPAS